MLIDTDAIRSVVIDGKSENCQIFNRSNLFNSLK